jgi:hypothetical protein
MMALIHWCLLLLATSPFHLFNDSIKNLNEPTITLNAVGSFCADLSLDCGSEAAIPFSIELDCPQSPTELEVTLLLDISNDGQFVQVLPPSVLDQNGSDYIATFVTVPGEHRFIIRAEDACGGISTAEHIFESGADCTPPPVPGCISILEKAIGEEFPFTNEETIEVSALIEGNLPDLDACKPGAIFYSVNLPGEIPNINQQQLSLNCDDLLCNNPAAIEVQAWDQAGNRSTCITQVQLTDQDALAPCIGVSVACSISTEEGNEVGAVQYEISGPQSYLDTTQQLFGYFNCLQEGMYEVKPFKANSYYNGVSTLDVILISQHVLGVNPLSSSYRIIAADVDGDNQVTEEDYIAISRMLVFGEINEFQNDMPSWRFVQSGYVFPNASNPWAEVFPEASTYNSNTVGLASCDFVGIKLGDVNLDAEALTGETEARSKPAMLPIYTRLKNGQSAGEYLVELRLSPSEMLGMQGTLSYDPAQLEWDGVGAQQMKGAYLNLGQHTPGSIPFNWIAQGDKSSEPSLMQFKFKVKAGSKSIDWPTALQINDQVIRAEAYDQAYTTWTPHLVFEAESAAELTIRPNPFQDNTTLDLSMDSEGIISLYIYDTAGKILLNKQWNGKAGENQLLIESTELPKGVMIYHLEYEGKKASGKMIKY